MGSILKLWRCFARQPRPRLLGCERQHIGRTEKASLNENFLLGKTESRNYHDLLSEVLDGLLSMTEGNWEDLSKELAGCRRWRLTES